MTDTKRTIPSLAVAAARAATLEELEFAAGQLGNEHPGSRKAVLNGIEALKASWLEEDRHEESFDLYYSACMRGAERWRAADPEGRRLMLPDTARMVEFILNRLTRVEAALSASLERMKGESARSEYGFDEEVAQAEAALAPEQEKTGD